jgi:drug/metabolite transporter (DMT)-like permease
MARALPVFFTMLGTIVFSWGKTLGALAITGMMIIFIGCMLMAFSNNSSGKTLREKLAFVKKGLPGILLAAFATTSYTISDSFGVKSVMEHFPDCNKLLAAGTYSCVRESLVTVALWSGAAWLAVRKKDEGNLKALLKTYHPYAAGIFAALAYVLILISMNYVSNVSFVQSFRQLSLPLSALLGYFILKEKISKLRWFALLLIMVGLLMSIF